MVVALTKGADDMGEGAVNSGAEFAPAGKNFLTSNKDRDAKKSS